MTMLSNKISRITISSLLVATSALTLSGNAHALLADGSVLSITQGTGGLPGTPSNFTMELFAGSHIANAISSNNGIIIGTIQPASGSHSGSPDGTESPGIDNPWSFFSNTGMSYTTSAVSIISDDGAGNVILDLSGWTIDWNGITTIPMNSDAWGANLDGQAIMDCSTDCSSGDTYTLYYTATVPAVPVTGFGGVPYGLNLVGTISIIQVPTLAVGVALADGDYSGNVASKYVATDPVPDDSGYSTTGSIYDFKINCGAPACSGAINIHIPAGIPANAVYRKYDGANWVTFTEDGNNTLESGTAASNDGTCQNATDYAASLTEGNDCFRITMRDGDANDADAVANIITDPGHIGVLLGGGTGLDAAGTSGCSIATNAAVQASDRFDWALILAFLAWIGVRRSKFQRKDT